MKLTLQVLSTLVIACYPVAVYFGLQYLAPGIIALLLCAILILRFLLNPQQISSMKVPLMVGIALTAASFVTQRSDWLLFYPVVINLSLLGLFAYSLQKGPSMIERLARLKHPDLPDSASAYLCKVTKLWCGLFIFNGVIAAYTAMVSSLEMWTLYNGFIAYVLIGILLSGEWLYRYFWLEKHE
jgi:uncharacterized membrane protein